jgi:ribose-phosphate pyrophosphokinase
MINYDPLRLYTQNGYSKALDINVYPDNTPIIKWNEDRSDDLFRSILVRPITMTDFVAAMFWVDAYKWRYGYVPHLVLPFVPGARQDRLNNSGDFLFTAKSVANMINDRNFPSVAILDPHSEVISALIDNCTVVHSDSLVSSRLYGEYSAVVSPDAGAEKRATRFSKALNIPLIHAWKTRNISTGAISGFGHEPIPGNICGPLLIVDDICDGGGTFLGLQKELQKAGYNSDLFVTHGIFSKGTEHLRKVFGTVYTTDSIPIRQQGIEVIEVCDNIVKGNF